MRLVWYSVVFSACWACSLGVQDKFLNVLQAASIAGLSTFLKHAEDAGLHDDLANKGPYTLFAPSNDAFHRLPDDVQKNKTLMKAIVMYHISPKHITHNDYVDDSTVETLLQGGKLRLNRYDFGGLFTPATYVVTGVRAEYWDRYASNGRVYILEDVIYPMPTDNIFEAAALKTDFSTLSFLLVKDKLDGMLKNGPHFTVFAPTNEAFQKLPSDKMNRLLSNTSALDETLKYHVLQSTYYTAAIPADKGTLQLDTEYTNKRLTLAMTGGGVTVNGDTNIVSANLTVTNGVIHVIDKVLTPP